MRRLRAGDPVALLGFPPFPHLELATIQAAARTWWGWSDATETAGIDPDRTVAGWTAALARLDDVAARGGRVAFATGRPASLLALYRSLAARVVDAGGGVPSGRQAGPFRADGRSGRFLWWSDGVGVLTDGRDLLATTGAEAAAELLFTLPRPDLLVGDVGFAAGAVRSGIETVALGGLDSVALGVAASAVEDGSLPGAPCTIVPLHDACPPAAYELLLGADDQARAERTA